MTRKIQIVVAALFSSVAVAWWFWPPTPASSTAWLWAALLGVFCTGAAYLLYFRLIAHVGPARAISVTFLIPIFAVLWGYLFLGETITPVMAGACLVIVAGTALATGLVAPGRAIAGARS